MERTTINLPASRGRTRSVFYRLGALSCLLLMLYSVATMLIVVFIGGPPQTAHECYAMLHENRLHGLLRLDVLTVFVMPFYFLLFYSIYWALRRTNTLLSTFSNLLVFAGLTLFLASPSVFSYLHLSDQYAAALSEVQKSQLLSAGESIVASDMWHGTGARIGGLLLQTGALLISVVMLKSPVFGKATAYSGILTHGLDLGHVIFGFFAPAISIGMMALAGPLYLLWFPLVGWNLWKLGRERNKL